MQLPSHHVEDPETNKVALGPSRAGQCFELPVATRLRMIIWTELSRLQPKRDTSALSTVEHHIALTSPPPWFQSAIPPTLLPAPTQPLLHNGNHSPTSVPKWPPTHPKARHKRPERTRSSSHLHSPSSAWPVLFVTRSNRSQQIHLPRNPNQGQPRTHSSQDRNQDRLQIHLYHAQNRQPRERPSRTQTATMCLQCRAGQMPWCSRLSYLQSNASSTCQARRDLLQSHRRRDRCSHHSETTHTSRQSLLSRHGKMWSI
jgi:hypothetical protein